MTRNNQEIITRCSPLAERLGIHPEMPLALARALNQEIHAIPWNPQQEFRELYRLALWVRRFSPLTGVEEQLLRAARNRELATVDARSWGIVLETTGTERVHRGEAKLTQRLYRALQRAGIEAQVAIAPTIGMAWALSRCAPHRITISNRLSPPGEFPLSALRLPQETLTGLAQIGICSIQQLLRIPRQTLGVRFGTLLLRRLDEAQGAIPETLHVITPRARFRATHLFDAGIFNREQLNAGIQMVLEQLVKELQEAHRKLLICTLHLHGRTAAGARTTQAKRLALHTATDAPTTLLRLWSVALERLSLPPRIETIALEATQTDTAQGNQIDAFGEAGEHSGDIDELLNTFAVSLGEEAVQQAELTESYLPEESFRFHALSRQKSHTTSLDAQVLIPQRPPLLFPKPQPMRTFAMLPDKPPAWFEWRGKRHQVRHSSGPERISASWNGAALGLAEEEDTDKTREYFRLEDESGRWLWVFRERASLRWFVHGVWA